jgi:hypothetical protein
MGSHILNKGDKARLDAARREAAGVLAELAVEISDAVGANPDATTAQVQSARLQVETRKWLAGVLDAHTFAPAQRHDVALDIGALHISALRARTAELRQQLEPLPVEIVSPTAVPQSLRSGEAQHEVRPYRSNEGGVAR